MTIREEFDKKFHPGNPDIYWAALAGAKWMAERIINIAEGEPYIYVREINDLIEELTVPSSDRRG